ncbi:uncharacterized protein B0J16DRAFT_335437 [Fusarium flagelliforme]|uniref:uncharacterized protein n=1 Tax=Fusarium flagelliforme TaxID=2675880 RepID=UPI001E8E2903|nr:uncharacterized protein B0J16DRAFT_335437 [Fusarium flagelliforme]KAH7193531.1 hypothetical protein B0J16DRAFT_335437 [Fusarium flagelliforme]
MKDHQLQEPAPSPFHQLGNNPYPHYTSKDSIAHRWTQIPNVQLNSPTPFGIMNRPHSLDLSFTSSDNQPQGVGGNGYPVQVTYGGWQPNTIWHSSAPRSMANGNWRGPQMSTDQMNAQPSGTNNYSLMPSPLPRASTSNVGPVSISDCLSGYAYCVKRADGRYTRLVPADRLPPLNEIPATQASAQGMVLLPDLHMKPPQGVATMNQSVTVKVRELKTTNTDKKAECVASNCSSI